MPVWYIFYTLLTVFSAVSCSLVTSSFVHLLHLAIRLCFFTFVFSRNKKKSPSEWYCLQTPHVHISRFESIHLRRFLWSSGDLHNILLLYFSCFNSSLHLTHVFVVTTLHGSTSRLYIYFLWGSLCIACTAISNCRHNIWYNYSVNVFYTHIFLRKSAFGSFSVYTENVLASLMCVIHSLHFPCMVLFSTFNPFVYCKLCAGFSLPHSSFHLLIQYSHCMFLLARWSWWSCANDLMGFGMPRFSYK